ncbi:succinate dehydrogenase, cytochrome b556 subunit [Pokkaliibacter sp. MBI-7]|uniref:Succinate dehydrogenase cytochrome b556 subunit n=1 Tax=Proteobacteria bacterium 228 TaxID=2083153 RepID=A0A2S5KX60_9PROT|nr:MULTISPECIES: succinate dehydrogenase, cytochrome b556 subunit [Pokkaliibacter]MDH2435873.1 succinate dehydrogenase, cytochrome b556 subunit [Pokkaliibacter sp. MBI-7]PPC79441.1 succinate dehydrogenase, cytochrome b556 subunit [Pokkaliibacter plantistimulans]
MNKKRPVNLDLTTIKQPLPAISSILHRITGVALFVGLVFMMYALDQSLTSEESFNSISATMQHSFFAKLIAWGLLTALFYHLCAGIKHLLQDFGYCEELESGHLAAKVTLAAGVVFSLLMGIWVW